MPEPESSEPDQSASEVEQDSIEVHWQHPRHDQDQPVLLVMPHPTREQWAAEITDDQYAVVVSRRVLWETQDNEIERYSEAVDALDPVPGYVAEALRDYDSNYGPVKDVVNPVEEADDEVPEDTEFTIDAYFSEADPDA